MLIFRKAPARSSTKGAFPLFDFQKIDLFMDGLGWDRERQKELVRPSYLSSKNNKSFKNVKQFGANDC